MDLTTIWEECGLDSLQSGVDRLFPNLEISVENMLEQIITGDFGGAFGDLFRQSLRWMSGQLSGIKNIFLWLVLLGILSALISRFAEIFDRHQVADMSFYFMYLLFSTILLKCFSEIAVTTNMALEAVTQFIRVLLPAYMITIGLSAGAVTVSAACQIMLLVVYGVEHIMIQVVVPLLNSYIILALINGIWSEEKLTLFIELLEKGVRFLLKGALWVITGISVFQALIAPVRDSFRNSVLEKVIEGIPGVGSVASGAVELILGSAMVIRRSVGVLLILLMLILCVVPLLKITVIAGILKCSAAFMGIVSDKRYVSCTNRVGEAGLLMLRTMATAMLLFWIAVAVLTATCGVGI